MYLFKKNNRVLFLSRGCPAISGDLKSDFRSEIIGRVVGHANANDTMLRRSVQLLLTPENEHFQGSLHLARRNLKESRYTPCQKKDPISRYRSV